MAFTAQGSLAGEPCCGGGPKMAKIAPQPWKSRECRLLGSREPGRIAMTHLLTLVALGLAIALAPIPGEAASKRIHVIGNVLEQTFTGDLQNPSQTYLKFPDQPAWVSLSVG